MANIRKSPASTVKIGLAAFCANWFKEVGLQGKENPLETTLKRDYAAMVGFIEECFASVVAPGVISSVKQAKRACEIFRTEKIDAFLLVHIMWSEDPPLLALLDGCRELPCLLWNYHPTGFLPKKLMVNDLFRYSGTVGLLQGSAPMQKRGIRFDIVAGGPGDSRLKETLREYGTAFGIRKEFCGLSAGRIAGRCEVMTGTHADKDALLERLGVNLVEITAQEYAAVCASVTKKRIDKYYADLLARFPVKGVSEESLCLVCRNTLALDDLVSQYNLSALAIQDLDQELHRLVGARPCLCPPASAKQGVAFGMESDLNTTLGLLVAMQITNAPSMFTEIFTFDPKKNILLMGHAGIHDPRLSAGGKVAIVPDEEYRYVDKSEGAWQEFILAKGPVTCISLYDTGKDYRMTVFEGRSLGPPCKLQGFAHAVVKPALPVEQLLSKLVQLGMTQHFVIAPGHFESILEKWCRTMGIDFLIL